MGPSKSCHGDAPSLQVWELQRVLRHNQDQRFKNRVADRFIVDQYRIMETGRNEEPFCFVALYSADGPVELETA